jgi:hypothetical protein
LATTAFIAGAVKGTATDNVGVSRVKVKLYRKRLNSNNVAANEFWNGTAFVATSTLVSATYNNGTWSLDNMPPQNLLDSGVYSVVAYGYDVTGNVGASTIINFNLSSDVTAPTINITNPLSGSSIDVADFGRGTIRGEATDNVGVTSVKVKLVRKRNNITYFWNGSSFGTTSALVEASVLDASISSVGYPNALWSLGDAPTSIHLDNGLYTIYSYAYDAAGNVKASASRSFTITGIEQLAFGSSSASSSTPGSSAGGS